MLIGRFLLSLAALGGVSAQATPVMYGGNAERTFAYASSAPSLPAAVKWRKTIPGMCVDSPMVAGDLVIAVCWQGIHVFAAANGAPLWSTPPDGTEYTPGPAVDDRAIYTTTYTSLESSSFFAAFDRETGVKLWSTPLGSHRTVPSLLVNETVYVGLDNGELRAFDKTDGAVQWSTALPGLAIAGPPAYANGVLLVPGRRFNSIQPDEDGDLFAVDASDGHILWRTNLNQRINAAPIVVGAVVYVVSGNYVNTNPTLSAIEITSGNAIWRVILPLAIDSEWAGNLAADDGKLVITSNRESLTLGIDAATGAIAWRANVGGEGLAIASMSHRVLIEGNFAAQGVRLATLDLGSGALLGSALDPGFSYAIPSLANGVAYTYLQSSTPQASDLVAYQ